ncbi:hypothetical protein Tco_0629976 [Tanacetum coccineum]|uniref:DUF4283 domain-containing protein n=1 Tax=Tanacetum coccineum TaxID=301880 RepID=A0ABQ4WUQ1_9ASTR
MERGFLSQKGNLQEEKEVVSSSVVDETMAKEKQSSLVDTTLGSGNRIDVVVPVESIRDISERFTNTAYGFFLGKRVAYPVVANYVRNTWGKYGLVKLHGVPVTAFSEDGLIAIATKVGTPLMLDSYTSDMCMQSWGRLSYARAMIKLRADVELKDNIVVFGHVQEECPNNIGSGETQNLKKTSQTPKGTNGETLNLASQEANSSGSSFWNVDPSSPSTTPIIDKIDNIENLIIDGKVTLVDDKRKHLEKVDYSGDFDSEDEVASVDNEMASFLAKKDGYGTQSLLEQWKESYENDDYEYDPYDDDMSTLVVFLPKRKLFAYVTGGDVELTLIICT